MLPARAFSYCQKAKQPLFDLVFISTLNHLRGEHASQT